MPRILIAEDEPNIAELVKYNLVKAGYIADYEVNGEKAYNRILSEKPDLVILDIMLPSMDGLEICRRIRQNEKNSLLPIIMLSAKGEIVDRVIGLELGADDYLAKPFNIRELVTRVKALIRRTQYDQSENKPDNQIISGNLVIYPEKYEAFLGGIRLDLTIKEFQMLQLLAENDGKYISRERILDSIWGYDHFGDTRTVDVHIRHLRQKTEDASPTICIETLRGIGYRLKSINPS